ncbi:hypothetical protein F2P79_024730 [Pimephales promelas]|nr:hypothetical protein F2P79_024730 [Pimephales promelas]
MWLKKNFKHVRNGRIVFAYSVISKAHGPANLNPQSLKSFLSCCFLSVTLQHMAEGDDTIREALYHLRDLMDYAHLFTFDMNSVYMPNVHIESGEMCSCKEFIAQELLKTLVSAEITEQDGAVESRTALRLLQHNIRFLLQNSSNLKVEI